MGQEQIVQQHGLTVGELARFLDAEMLPADAGGRLVDLTVVPVTGWSREQTFADTGLTWVMPSPNMPTPDTALLYPGTCLFEATNLSEGRGTTRPFELLGAPYIDHRWAEALQARDVPGVEFREAYFTPTFSKQAGKVCGGVQVHVTDPSRVEAITAATHMMVEARRLYPEFDWRGDGGRWIDLLTGSTRFRDMLGAGAPAAEIVGAWREELSEWNRRRDDRTSSTVARADDRAAPGGRGGRLCRPAGQPAGDAGCTASALHAGSHGLPPRPASARTAHRTAPPGATTGRSPASRRRAPCCVTARRPAWGSTPRRSATRWTRSPRWEQPAGTTHPLYAGAVTLLGHEGRWSAQTPAATPCATPTVPGPSCRATSGSPCATTRSSTWPRSPSCSPPSS